VPTDDPGNEPSGTLQNEELAKLDNAGLELNSTRTSFSERARDKQGEPSAQSLVYGTTPNRGQFFYVILIKSF
jgi:hypothetical protein